MHVYNVYLLFIKLAHSFLLIHESQDKIDVKIIFCTCEKNNTSINNQQVENAVDF